MAVLFEKDQSVIARHIKKALEEGELDESNMLKMHNTLSKYKPITVYNLDVIISVGYRVHSQRGVQFRRWANSVLKDYLMKGYAVKNDLVQQKYDDPKALVDVMGRTMGYLDSPADDQIRSDYVAEQGAPSAAAPTDSFCRGIPFVTTKRDFWHRKLEKRLEKVGIVEKTMLEKRRKRLTLSWRKEMAQSYPWRSSPAKTTPSTWH